MDLFDLYAKLSLDTGAYEKGIENAKGMADKLGNGLKTAFKISASAIGVATTAVGAFGSQAVKAYANYEQLVGGVETLFKDSADTIQRYAEQAYRTAGLSANEYMETVTRFSASLIQSTKGHVQQLSEAEIQARRDALDEQYELVKEQQSKEYDALKEGYDDAYDALSESLSEEYEAIQDQLSEQYDLRRDELDKQYDAVSKELDAEIEAAEKANEATLKEAEKAYEANVKAYEEATNARIALINEEYNESIKLVDEEKYAQLKALDAQIDAINAEAEAEAKAREQAERENKRTQLQKAIDTATSAEDREKAEQELAEYEAKIAQKMREEQRKAQINELKQQKEQVKEISEAKKKAAKEQKDEAVNQVKETSQATLDAMSQAHKEEIESLKESQKNQIQEMKDAKSEKLKAIKETNDEELKALKKAQQDELKTIKKAQDEQLKSLKKSQEDQLKAYKNAQDKKLEELKRSLDAEKEMISQANADSMASVEAMGADYERAAQIADMAIKDMSDNANKMGTSMESIQNAYQGFAKQNYTMLDNLSLGYGGTKSEMERLLADAEKLSGQHYDISNLTDVYQAIHEIQKSLGITGATEEEAMRTIEGASKMTKAAWQNVVTALGRGEGIEDAFDGLTTAIFGDEDGTGLINQITPRIKTILSGIAGFLVENAPVIAEKLPDMITELIPSLIEGGITLAGALATGIAENLPEILKAIFDGISEAVPGAKDALDALWTVIDKTFGWIMDNGDWLIGILAGILGGFMAYKTVTGIIEAVSTAQALLNTVMAANPIMLIVTAIGALVAAFITLWNNCEEFREFWINVWEGIKEALAVAVEWVSEKFTAIKEFASAAWQGIKDTFSGIGSWFSEKFNNAKEAASKAWNGIKEKMSTSWSNIKSAFSNVGSWFSEKFKDAKEKASGAWSNAKSIFSDVWTKIKEGFSISDAFTWGKDMINNFIDGIKEKWNALKDKVSGVASSIKDFLGFSEPKKGPLSNFHTYAPDMMKLFAKGIADNERIVTNQIEKSFDFQSEITVPTVTSTKGNISYDERVTPYATRVDTDREVIIEAIKEALSEFEIDWNGKTLGRLIEKYA